jgi:tetratricopeptide (TPR) repeat protein
MVKGEFRQIEPLLSPFFGQDKPARYETYLLQGLAYQKAGDWERAISTLDEAIAHYGINAVILKSIGECYLGKGDEKAALTAWEKSLELNPDQPDLRRTLEALKGKK